MLPLQRLGQGRGSIRNMANGRRERGRSRRQGIHIRAHLPYRVRSRNQLRVVVVYKSFLLAIQSADLAHEPCFDAHHALQAFFREDVFDVLLRVEAIFVQLADDFGV